MDKNMINIDDLLRQRLGDAEEPERAGAWGNMRDLLDKQMPADRVPAAATNWRRMFAYVAGVALLAALSVGGYQVSQTFENGEGGLALNTPDGNKVPSATTGLAGSAIESLPDTRKEAQATEQPAPATDAHTEPLVSTQPAQSANEPKAVAGTDIAQPTDNNKSINKLNTSNLNSINNSVASNNKPVNTVTNTNISANNTTVYNSGSTSSNTSGNTAAPDIKSTTGTANNNNTSGNGTGSRIKEDAPEKLATGGMNETNVEEPAEVRFKEVPYQKIEVNERLSKNGIVYDTIFNGEDVMKVKDPQQNNIAVADNTNDDNTSGDMMPAANTAGAEKGGKSEDVVMEKLGDHRVSRKKMKNYNPHRFEEMVKNAKYRMGSIKFYPGIVFGANAAFNGNFGVQGGLALNTSISERWNILTEVKYAYRFNNSKENLQDDYIDNVKTTTIQGQPATTYDSMEHYYNFTNYSSVEAPILLTYKHQRMRFMVGANFVYNFRINSLQEVEVTHSAESGNISTNTGIFESDKQILLSDFTSNFNIGPMVGFGYNVSPAWRLDMRATLPAWSNASSTGQKEIARRLYNQPQMQFNISYRFGSNKNKPYKRRH